MRDKRSKEAAVFGQLTIAWVDRADGTRALIPFTRTERGSLMFPPDVDSLAELVDVEPITGRLEERRGPMRADVAKAKVDRKRAAK